MNNLKIYARIFYAIGIIGIGCLHFIYAGFRPMILPIPATATQNVNFLVYLTGMALVITGIMIVWGKKMKIVSLFLGIGLLLFFMLGHLPNRLINGGTVLAMWTDALKLLAFSGGAFMIAKLSPDSPTSDLLDVFNKIASFGRYFFAFMLVIFGIDHFIYVDFVKTLVPDWIGLPIFWTYFTGMALMGAGLAVFINFQLKTISLLLGLMLFLWFFLLHIPRAIIAPTTDNGNELTSVFQCLAFCGIALLLLYSNKS